MDEDKFTEKALNAAINSELFSYLEEQHKHRAQTKKRVVEWAIRVWTSLPAEVQAALVEHAPTSPDDLYHFLAEHILDLEVLKILSGLSPQERLNALRTGSWPKKKVSRKKQAL